MINPQDFSKARTVLKPEHLNGANIGVATIRKCEEIEISGDKKIVMQFDEFPDPNAKEPGEYMNYFPNLTSIRNLVDGLGNNEKKYLGEKIVLEVVKTNDPKKKRQVSVLWIAPSDTWDEHFKEFAKRKPTTPTTGADGVTPTGRKTGGRKTAARR